MLAYQEVFNKKDKNEDEYRNKKIHVRSKDPSRIARQFEKTSSSKSKKSRDKGVSYFIIATNGCFPAKIPDNLTINQIRR